MEKAAKGLETLAKGGSNIKETHLGLMIKNKKTMKTKGLCSSYHEHGHRSFQCPKRPCQAAALGLIAPKEGEKNKKPWGKKQGAYPSVDCHIGMNGGT
jgi:hypothetical protein